MIGFFIHPPFAVTELPALFKAACIGKLRRSCIFAVGGTVKAAITSLKRQI